MLIRSGRMNDRGPTIGRALCRMLLGHAQKAVRGNNRSLTRVSDDAVTLPAGVMRR